MSMMDSIEEGYQDDIAKLRAEIKRLNELVFAYESTGSPVNPLLTENEKLKKLIKGNEEICRQRNIEIILHEAAAKAAKSGLKADLDAYLELKETK